MPGAAAFRSLDTKLVLWRLGLPTLVGLAALLGAASASAGASTPRQAPASFSDRVIVGHPHPVRHAAASPKLTFVIDSTWSQSDAATLAEWLAPGSLEMQALREVVGPPSASQKITVTDDPSSPFAGEYDLADHTVTMAGLELDVLMHELNHASHGPWILTNGDVWEEGMARAAEVDEMGILASEGVSVAQAYGDLHHSTGDDVLYDNLNVADIGMPGGEIYTANDALAFVRYQESGYAFGKLLIQKPLFLRQFNRLLYQQPSGQLSVNRFEALASQVQPRAEGQPFRAWYARQLVFGRTPPQGCRLFAQLTSFAVNVFCRTTTGETAQQGVTVIESLTGAHGEAIWSGQAVTNSLGAAIMTGVDVSGYPQGRIRIVATATVQGMPLRITRFLAAGTHPSVYGVIRNELGGTVRLSSPSGRFKAFTVPVTNGAFATTRLANFAGMITATYTGTGKNAKRVFVKDAAPYSLVLEAT